ncbi:hypothetical protein ACPW96_22740 [Micromonospora sp. DT81.3]|uniref:hypothetical protein n=1 Tax=Micromonospora sp. DT81.3 TaxID=3416523 RepID=UPI003CEA8558
MVRTVRELGRNQWRKALIARLGPAVVWAGVLITAAFVIDFIDKRLDSKVETWPEPLGNLIEPTAGLQTVVQVVPAIVIAIFVFAAGTLFVVAQVVPPARGTRAVDVLRERHLAWTISPALALTPLTILVLVLETRFAWPLAIALLLGAFAYLLLSTGYLLSILGEATSPIHFAAVLANSQDDAIAVLNPDQQLGPDPRKWWRWVQDTWQKIRIERRRRMQGGTQAAVDGLYDVVRTLRGWTRSAATSGDSRELLVALEGTLDLVRAYASVPINARHHVPWEYDHTAESPETSPSVPNRSSNHEMLDPGHLTLWAFWVPPPYLRVRERTARRTDGTAGAEAKAKAEGGIEAEKNSAKEVKNDEYVRRRLAEVWVANEVGRSLVRAVEFATVSKALLDRDRSRLLLSLEKAVWCFAGEPGKKPRDVESAGVLVAYLIELGLGVRRCPPEEVEWHFEPLIRLAVLHRDFCESEEADARLVIGSAAAVLKVAEAITAARIREQEDKSHRQENSQDDNRKPTEATSQRVEKIRDRAVEQTVQNLRNVEELRKDGQTFTLFEASDTVPRVNGQEMSGSALALAGSPLLEPRQPSVIHPTDTTLLEELQNRLL